MKKKLIILAGSLMALAIGATTYFSVNSDSEMSLLMQNVEALADGESGSYPYQTMGRCPNDGGMYYKCDCHYTAEYCRRSSCKTCW